MGRDDRARRQENILDAASDYVSNESYNAYGAAAEQSTLRPGDLDFTREPGGSSGFRSPEESPARDDAYYKARGRDSPTRRDRSARPAASPGAHPPCCVCEACTCGGHCCPSHGSKKPQEKPRSRFEGQSSHARDYVAPPAEALRDAFPPGERGPAPSTPIKPSGSRPKFEGMSNSRRDYTPPPVEAYRATQVPESKQKMPNSRPPFEGQSMHKRDFVAPPMEAYQGPEKGTTTPTRRKGAPFEGESMNRRDFVPPPREAYVGNQPAPGKGDGDKRPTGRRPPFEGEAMSKRDYVAPPAEAYQKLAPAAEKSRTASKPRTAFEGQTSQQRDFVSPPQEAYDNKGPGPSQSKPKPRSATRFEGESQARRDYVAPPREAYQAPEAPENQAKPRAASRFEGESMSRSHYTNPPKDAYARPEMGADSGKKRPEGKETRDFQSNAARSYGAPPVASRCRAEVMLEDNGGPPTPGSGRQHVYWDPSSKKWL